jgi:hypothetical protein
MVKQVAKDRFGNFLVYSPLIASTLFAKVSVPPFGAQGIGVTYPLVGLFVLAGLLSRRLGIDVGRAAYFAILFGTLGLVQVIREEAFSLSGFVLLGVSSLLYTFRTEQAQGSVRGRFKFFSNYCAILAVFGIVQFLAQFAIGPKNAFPVESFLPAGFLIHGFHYLNPLYYGSSVLKANGIFLLEPSFFSQLMAIALLVELSFETRIRNIIVISLAIIFSYSGTGILILVISLPIALVKERRADILLAIIGLAMAALLFATPLKLDIFLERAGEFTDPNSSAYIRFVSWYALAKDALSVDAWHALFGYGTGTFRAVGGEYSSSAAEIFHSKMLIEYGIAGFSAYLGFVLYCLFSSPLPLAVKVGALVMTFMAGAFAEPVTGVILTLILLAPRITSAGSKVRRTGISELNYA